MSLKSLSSLAAALALVASPAAAGTFVAANYSGTTDLGFFDAGSWLITGSGLVELTFNVGQLQLNPDGTPSIPAAPPYDYFNPGGSTIGDGGYGAGGTLINLGSLMGSFVARGPFGNFPPASPPADGSYFAIGYGTTVHLAAAGHLYAQVNDTFYSNNSGGFTVEVTRVLDPGPGVPEPGAWAVMILGFGGVGAAMRRRRAGFA